MGITAYQNNVVTETVTKSFSDFQVADTTKSVDIFTLDAQSGVLSFEVDISKSLGGIINSNCLLDIHAKNGDMKFIEKVNVSSNNIVDSRQKIRNCMDYPYVAIPTAWTISGDANIIRHYPASCGTQTAQLMAGGNDLFSIDPDTTEEGNGTIWTFSSDLNLGRSRLGGFGTQTAAAAFGGTNTADSTVEETEEYDGATWTSSGNLNVGRRNTAGCGIQTAGLAVGGNISGADSSTSTEEYNGTVWTTSGSLNTARQRLGNFGTQSSSVTYSGDGGNDGPYYISTEEYNGASWSSGNDMITSSLMGPGSAGTLSAGLSIGGSVSPYVSSYDGTNWSAADRLNVARRGAGTGGTGSLAWASCGYSRDYEGTLYYPIASENYDSSSNPTNETYTATINSQGFKVWSIGGNLSNARRLHGSGGSQSAAYTTGGIFEGSTYNTSTEEYNGTSWSAGGAISQSAYGIGASGTQTAGLKTGGRSSVTAYEDDCEEYNGASWSAGGTLSAGRRYHSTVGTQTASLTAAGSDSGNTYVSSTEEYNGASWSSGGTMLTGRYKQVGVGKLDDAILYGGQDVSTEWIASAESYDGATWAVEGSLNYQRTWFEGAGTTHMNALSFRGLERDRTPTWNSDTEEYDGVSWAMLSSTNVISAHGSGAGNHSFALASGGYIQSLYMGETEEFHAYTANDLDGLDTGSLTFTVKYINYNS